MDCGVWDWYEQPASRFEGYPSSKRLCQSAPADTPLEVLSVARVKPLTPQLDRHRRGRPPATRRPQDQDADQPRRRARTQLLPAHHGRGYRVALPRLGMDDGEERSWVVCGESAWRKV
jgi:hypothetical protein